MVIESKVWLILNRKGRQKAPILNDQANITPILNGFFFIRSIHLNPKKDPFHSKLCGPDVPPASEVMIT